MVIIMQYHYGKENDMPLNYYAALYHKQVV